MCGPISSVPIANAVTISTEPPTPISIAGPITWWWGVSKNVIVHSHTQPQTVNRIPSTIDIYACTSTYQQLPVYVWAQISLHSLLCGSFCSGSAAVIRKYVCARFLFFDTKARTLQRNYFTSVIFPRISTTIIYTCNDLLANHWCSDY